jgi:hypothetical protein
MNINDWEEPPDGAGNHTQQLLVINWQLTLWIERQYQEQQELARQFEEELDALFALIHSPESTLEGFPDPPDWPNL